MIKSVETVVLEQSKPDWMIRFAILAKSANRISIQKFDSDSAALGFIRTICTEQNLSFALWTDDSLVVERR